MEEEVGSKTRELEREKKEEVETGRVESKLGKEKETENRVAKNVG